MKTRLLLTLFGLLFMSLSYADDTDIYIDNGEARTNPPYLMLMIDYRASTGSNFCNDLAGCVDKMSENAFAKLCTLYTGSPEAICRTFYRDELNDITSQTP